MDEEAITSPREGALSHVSHVEINVSNLDVAVNFYSWFLERLGYKVYQEWDQGRSWKLGPTYIVVAAVDERHRGRVFHRRGPGLNHLAFHAATRERVDQMRETLTARGIRPLYDSPDPERIPYALYFEGPDRLKIEYVYDSDEQS
ncbi:MAG: VOC family protein [Actinomycetota bacterium]